MKSKHLKKNYVEVCKNLIWNFCSRFSILKNLNSNSTKNYFFCYLHPVYLYLLILLFDYWFTDSIQNNCPHSVSFLQKPITRELGHIHTYLFLLKVWLTEHKYKKYSHPFFLPTSREMAQMGICYVGRIYCFQLLLHMKSGTFNKFFRNYQKLKSTLSFKASILLVDFNQNFNEKPRAVVTVREHLHYTFPGWWALIYVNAPITKWSKVRSGANNIEELDRFIGTHVDLLAAPLFEQLSHGKEKYFWNLTVVDVRNVKISAVCSASSCFRNAHGRQSDHFAAIFSLRSPRDVRVIYSTSCEFIMNARGALSTMQKKEKNAVVVASASAERPSCFQQSKPVLSQCAVQIALLWW